APVATGDTVTGSAYNLAVSAALLSNPGALASGKLVRSLQPADGTSLYTYERFSGDNSVAAQLAELSTRSVAFSATGNLSAQTDSLGSYASQVIGSSATITANFNTENANN